MKSVNPVMPLASQVAEWVSQARYEDLPSDVVASTKLRILDVIGLALAGAETPFGRSTLAAAVAMSPPGPSRIFGTGDAVGAPTAAFANASLSQALEYDDTHNESIVHMSSPAVAASLALAETRPVSGRELILAIAIANEVSCRVGSVSSGQFHRRGFHPTGLFAPFGIAMGAGKILGLDAEQPKATADTVIILWMGGGMASTETFDPKRYTPYEKGLDPKRVLSTFPSIDPAVDNIKFSAGREKMSDELQALCFLAGANSIFIGDKLLTTPNPLPSRDEQLITRLGVKPMRSAATR